MFVYALQNRQGNVNPRTQIYTLKFISLEAIRDHQTRISQAFSGGIDQMVIDVCKNYLNTKKDILVEETKGNYKIVVPRIKPTQAIENFRKNARSKDYENSGFHFYENALGFNLNHTKVHIVKKTVHQEKSRHYTPKVKNVGNDDIYDLQSVEDFKIIQQFNTLENTFNGVYSSRLITHDLFTKTFKEYDFDYNVEYGKQNHLEQDASGGKRDDNGILPYFNYDKGDTFGTKNEGVLHFQSSTSKVHNDYEQPEAEEILQKRISQHIAANNLIIEITVPHNNRN